MCWTRRSRSCASSSHGATPPSWSSEDTRISSPGSKPRPTVRESMKFSEVMFGPKITSWGSQPRNAAAFASASVTIAPTRRLVSYAAPMFALASRSVRATASPTESGTWLPPGASRNANPLSSGAEAPPDGGGVEYGVSHRSPQVARAMITFTCRNNRQYAPLASCAHQIHQEAELAFRVIRTAQASWSGTVPEGGGRIALGSGVFEGPFTLRARTEEGVRGTNPEELIGAGHAGCFTMSLANLLSEEGHPPEDLQTTAHVVLEQTRHRLHDHPHRAHDEGARRRRGRGGVRALRRAGEGDVPGVARARRDADHARRATGGRRMTLAGPGVRRPRARNPLRSHQTGGACCPYALVSGGFRHE